MKIICVGRNYSEHARELQNEVPKEPVLFLKPETALLPKNHPFIYPGHTSDLHYELELVLRINKLGKHINPKFAKKYFDQIGLGIDFTARDVQRECKSKGLPWEKAKAFDHSAVLSKRFINKTDLDTYPNLNFRLLKNGEVVQNGQSIDMIFDFSHLISYISKYFTLKIGDLIFTGTPAGVGPAQKGDKLEGYLEDQKLLEIKIK